MSSTGIQMLSARALCLAALLLLTTSCRIAEPMLPWVEWRHPRSGTCTCVMDQQGNSYVATGGKLIKLSPDGEVTRRTSLGGPDELELQAVGEDGRVCGVEEYEYLEGTLYVYGPDGSLIGTLDSVYRAYFGPEGNVYAKTRHQLKVLAPDLVARWTLDLGSGKSSYPALGPDGAVHIVVDTLLLVFNPDSSLRWSVSVPQESLAVFPPGTPGVDRLGNVYVPGDSIAAYGPEGTLRWRAAGSCTNLSLDSHGNIYYYEPIDSAGRVVALRPDGTVKLRGILTQGADFWTTVVPSDWGRVYCTTLTSEGYGGLIWRYWIYAIDSNGRLSWKKETDDMCGKPLCGPEGLVCFTSGDWLFGLHDN